MLSDDLLELLQQVSRRNAADGLRTYSRSMSKNDVINFLHDCSWSDICLITRFCKAHVPVWFRSPRLLVVDDIGSLTDLEDTKRLVQGKRSNAFVFGNAAHSMEDWCDLFDCLACTGFLITHEFGLNEEKNGWFLPAPRAGNTWEFERLAEGIFNGIHQILSGRRAF